jgi:hypothetical protein
MDIKFRDDFIGLWKKYFNNAELPIFFYYTDVAGQAEQAKPASKSRCVMVALRKVRQGDSASFSAESDCCFGGKKFLGYLDKVSPDFEYFLSCGIPGKVEGERYKKSPALVAEFLRRSPQFKAPARKIVFKRWDNLESTDDPEVVIFFARPDILAGLFTLANFDELDRQAVITPMGSGCSSIVQNPYSEIASEHPRTVIGMFDISARPFVAPDELTFSVPMKKFVSMVQNMDESFLITKTWKTIQKRIE